MQFLFLYLLWKKPMIAEITKEMALHGNPNSISDARL